MLASSSGLILSRIIEFQVLAMMKLRLMLKVAFYMEECTNSQVLAAIGLCHVPL